MIMEIKRGIRHIRTLLSPDPREDVARADPANDWERVTSFEALQSQGETPAWKSRFKDTLAPLRPIVLERRGAWFTEVGLPHHYGAVLRSSQNGDAVRIRFPDTNEAKLVLLRHGWSGSAEVRVGSRLSRYELFDDGSGLLEVPLPNLAAAGGVVELTNTGAIAGSRDHQVWLIGYRCDDTLWPVELGLPLCRNIRLIEGEIGTFLTFRTDVGIADVLALYRIWGADELEVFAQYLSPGMNAIDVGANIGHHSVAMARLVGPDGCLLAVEPQVEINRLLAANLVANGIMNARVERCLVGECSGRASLSPIDYSTAGNFGAVDVARTSVEGEQVSMKTLDELVHEYYGDKPVHFVKLDVQSFELYVLRGAPNLLRTSRPVLYLEVSPYWMHQRGYDYREIFLLLRSHDYAWRNLLPGQMELCAQPDWDGEMDVEWNLVAFPDGGTSSDGV